MYGQLLTRRSLIYYKNNPFYPFLCWCPYERTWFSWNIPYT